MEIDLSSTFEEVIKEIRGKANLDGGNTFKGKQTLTSPPADGYSIDASGYIKGSWLQAPSTGKAGSNTGKVCVLDGSGWVYYRTPAEIVSDGGGATTSQIPTVNNGTLTIQKNGTNVQTFTANQSSSVTANITVPTKTSELTNDSGYTANKGTVTQVKLNGTTKSPDSAGLVDLGTISGGGGSSSNVTVDSPTINGVNYTVFGSGEYGSFIGTFSTEVEEGGLEVTVGNHTYYISGTTGGSVDYRLTIDKNDNFVYSTIVVIGGKVNNSSTSDYSTVPSNGVVKIGTNLTSSYIEHNRCVIIKG